VKQRKGSFCREGRGKGGGGGKERGGTIGWTVIGGYLVVAGKI